MTRKRLRDYGLSVGDLPTGSHNAITDVDGVRVGHTTLMSGEGPLIPGEGPVRTGVTVILPHGDNLYQQKVRATVHTINGFGKPCGFEEVRELGIIESPIALTNTLNVWRVADALTSHALNQNPNIGLQGPTFNALVGETNDSFLNDIQGRHVQAEHVWQAIESAESGPVAEGAVGAGTGTTCYQWKGGIGTSSRIIPEKAGGFIVGVLVQSNFGRAVDLRILGTPVGKQITPPDSSRSPIPDGGSIMIVLATDAPITSRQLGRISVRVAAGLARTGSVYNHGSGDFVIAFSTAERIRSITHSSTITRPALANEGKTIGWMFTAIADAVEEAIYNSLFIAETVEGRDDNIRHALPIDQVLHLLG